MSRSLMRWVRALLVCLMTLVLGCASAPWRGDRGQIPLDELLAGAPLDLAQPSPAPVDEEVLAVTAEMQEFLDRHVDRKMATNSIDRLQQLIDAINNTDTLRLVYDETTGTASDTFRAGRGNCMSFSNLFVALAREAGLNAQFQEVDTPPDWTMRAETFVLNRHVNVRVDLGAEGARVVDYYTGDYRTDYETRRISDMRALAHHYNNVAVEHMQSGDTASALALLRTATERDPQFSPAWANLGTLYLRTGHHAYAEAAYLRALEADDGDLVAMSNLASLYDRLGDRERAEMYRKEVGRHRGRNPYYRFWLGREALLAQDYDAAIRHLTYAIRKKKEEDQFYFLLGEAYLQKGNRRAARRWLSRAVEVAGTDALKQGYTTKMDALLSAPPEDRTVGSASSLDPSPVSAQDNGTVAGRVVDNVNLLALPGARVTVLGTNLEAATNTSGAFRIAHVPGGTQTLNVSFLGYDPASEEVTVGPGEAVNVRVELALDSGDPIEARGDRTIDAQTTALNLQRTAPNIVNVVSADLVGRFPDHNVAEAAQRLPGVSIERDQGEGRYVLVRGTEAWLNSTTLNGERLPVPDVELRSAPLDAIPTDLLQAVEVSKALTPDMDGDAIGGTVNLVTKEPTGDRRFQISAGVSDVVHAGQGTIRGAMTVGGRMADGKLRYLLSGSGSYRTFSSEGFEAEYDGGELDELQFSYSEINRQRYGVSAAIDYRMSDTSALFLNGLFSSFRDEEVAWHKRERVSEDRIVRDLEDGLSQRETMSISGGGRHLLWGGGELDYKVTFSESSETRPGDLLSSFQLKDVDFEPNVTPDSIDPDNIRANPLNEQFFNFTLHGIDRSEHETRDRDVVAAVNVRLPLGYKPGFSGFARFGGKYRRKDAFRQQPHAFYQSGDELELPNFLRSLEESPLPGVINDRYELGPFPAVGAMRALWPTLGGEPLRETDAGDYEAAEDVAAGYAMADVRLGTKWQLLGGVRYEHTSGDGTGYEVTFSEEGDHVETVMLNDSSDYGQLLPMLHLKLSPTDRTNLRLALTRTLARPNYYDLVPYSLVLRGGEEIERGNPDLLPTTSWNLDGLGEHFFGSVGLVSGGVFYKKLRDFIYPLTVFEEVDGNRWEITEPRNGEAATLLGVELAAQGQLRSLPEPLDALGLSANYTFTDSEAELPHREGETSALPGQSRHVGNLALFYDKGGFSGRLCANFHGRYLDEVGADAAGDIYYDSRVQLDFSVSQAVGDKARVFVEMRNLTNTPVRRYIGEEDRPIQEEYYDWWAFFGVTLNFGAY